MCSHCPGLKASLFCQTMFTRQNRLHRECVSREVSEFVSQTPVVYP